MQKKQPNTLRAVVPNKGLELAYRKKLMRLVDDMQHSVKYWLDAAYKKEGSKVLALDATPADIMQRALKKLIRQWQSKFDDESKKIAEWFVSGNQKYADSAFKDAWKSVLFIN